VGAVLRQPDLASTLRAISADPGVFYTGPLAERIAGAVDGWLTPDDLAGHTGDWVEPLRAPFAGWEIEEMPPNSQGMTALIGLHLMSERGLGPDDPPRAWVEAGIAAARTFMAIRDREIGDPAGMRRTPQELLGLRSAGDAGAAAPTPAAAAGDTSHFAIVDEDGLAVSCIQSVFDAFGSGIVVPGTGIVLQSRGSAFSLDDEHVNALRPGRRPLHTLAPGMATRAGRTAAVFGCMGGHAQTQIHVQLLAALAGRGEDPVAAVSAPRWVLGRSVRAEDRDGLPDLVAAAGHPVRRTEPYCQAMGHAQVIVADEDTGVLAGVADPRCDGAALGY
jgi:gamma-glutamyltranspeptidase/glutathione hydrolase